MSLPRLKLRGQQAAMPFWRLQRRICFSAFSSVSGLPAFLSSCPFFHLQVFLRSARSDTDFCLPLPCLKSPCDYTGLIQVPSLRTWTPVVGHYFACCTLHGPLAPRLKRMDGGSRKRMEARLGRRSFLLCFLSEINARQMRTWPW